MTLTMDVILTRDVAFDNLLPTTGYVNYMETKQCDSIIQCAAVCVFCAGLLYNQNTGTCHLLKARLYETSFDRNRTDIGWGLFIHNNGMYFKKMQYLDFCFCFCFLNWNNITNHLQNYTKKNTYMCIFVLDLHVLIL